MKSPPFIDGLIGEQEWTGIPSVEGLQNPNTGAPVSIRSRFWVGYDAQFVYFAARNYDDDPSTIHAVEYRTNASMPGDDSVTLLIDATGALVEVNEFTINPRGATNVQLAGGRAAKREWTGEFVAKGRITAEGWECEARIPWQIMRLPGKGTRDLRIDMSRHVSRLSDEFIHKYANNGHQQNIPIWSGVELPQQTIDRSIKLLPYVYGGYNESDHGIFDSGFDLKTQLNDRVTMVGTVNPDFRNIENQILSLDFSRFERIADESRPFFLEGADYIGTAIFASQMIGGFDVGTKAYGRLDDRTSFGLLDTIDFGRQNALLANVTYSPLPTLTYRVSASSLTTPGKENTAYLARVGRRINHWFFFGRTMGSQDTDEGKAASYDGSFGFDHGTTEANVGYTYTEKNFNPRLGFFPERDLKGWNGYLGDSRTFQKGPLTYQGGGVYGECYDHIDGGFYRKSFGSYGDITLRSQVAFHAGYNTSDFEHALDNTYSLGCSYPANDPYRQHSLNLTSGKIGGQDYRLISYSAGFRPIKGLQVSLSHQEYKIDESIGQSIIGLNYDLGRDRSVSGRTVCTDGDSNWYLALRQSGNRGAEYYVILGDPNARRFTKSLIVKLVVPFEIR